MARLVQQEPRERGSATRSSERVSSYSPLLGVGCAFNKNTFLSVAEKADMGIAPGVQLDYAFSRNVWAFAHIGYTFGAQVTSNMTADFKPGGGLGAYFAF